jgi:site-specific DNA recombinase
MAKDGRRLRCAIYTRKSSEEGLDKEFNSLDAQREACAAYVMSQQHEGWTLVSDVYDDGGYSGGSLDRPALQQLLADVRAGRIDVVVIYKIDRLTRSLSDFAKIVDALDAAEASFVSVTQAFSTTSSMGRLTLNVLLSFAQFEREVIAERIRDKVAASKAKGMWMGGGVPLGYAVSDRKLIAVPEEATTVRLIMERYLGCNSVRDLLDELHRDGVVSKRRQARNGSIKGGVPFRRGALYWLLSNRIYIGETVHKGAAYPGQHDAIVSRELFDAVQAKLARSVGKSAGGSRKAVSLLAGMIRDHHGRPMSPCHTRNHGRRYSYYASNMSDDASATALRLPAGELDATVRVEISKWLADGEETRALVSGLDASATSSLFDTCAGLAGRIVHAPIGEAREILRQLGLQVRVSSSAAVARFGTQALLSIVGLSSVEGTAVRLTIPTTQANYGHEPRLRLEPGGHHDTPRDERLVELIARAFAARDELSEMDSGGVAAMPVTRLRHLQRTARLSYLDPTIVRSILNGTQPKHLSARALWRMAELPLVWAAQRQVLQFPAA